MTTTTHVSAPESSPSIALALYLPLAAVVTALYIPTALTGSGSISLAATFTTVLVLPGIIAASTRSAIAPAFAYTAPLVIAAMLLAPALITGHSPLSHETPLHATMFAAFATLTSAAAPSILFADADATARNLTKTAVAALLASGVVMAAILWPLP